MNECTQMGWTNMVACLGLLATICFCVWLAFKFFQSID